MERYMGVMIVIVCLILAVPTYAQTVDWSVTVSAAEAQLSQVLESISNECGAEIVLIQDPEAPVTLDLQDTDVETAVHEAALQTGCSWVRLYALHKGDDPGDLVEHATIRRQVALARKAQFEQMTEEDKEALEAAVKQRVDDEINPPEGTPLGGYAVRARGSRDPLSRISVDDPLIRLMSPAYRDPASVCVQDAAIEDALVQFSLKTGFYVLADTDTLSGTVSLDLQDASVDDIIAAMAEQLECNWTRVYVVGHARELSNQEVDERLEGLLGMGMNRFWSEPPERRQEIINTIVSRSNELTGEQREMIRSSSVAKKVMTKFMNYTMQLPTDKRRELMPLMQQAARIMR
ncbi:MAG: hypothetical protein ACLFWB_07635 [Armatimonadota bacterium]